MSRIASAPILLPKGVEFSHSDGVVRVKGSKGELEMKLHPSVSVSLDDDTISVAPQEGGTMAMAGTMRALIANMVHGVTDGFEKKLELRGVGYRAQMQGKSSIYSLASAIPLISISRMESASRHRVRRKFWFGVATSSWLARSRPRFAVTGRRSPTRARVCATRTDASS